MARTPLFNRSELEAAFGLILPRDTAAACASRWFVEIAGEDVDADGNFLYEDWHVAAGVDDGEPDAIAFQDATVTDEQRAEGERRFWAGLSVADRVDLVMRFSDLHFALLALVSDDLAERMRVASGLTAAQAARSRAQMARAVAAVRSGA